MGERVRAVIDWFSTKEGYGFAYLLDRDQRAFIHKHELDRMIPIKDDVVEGILDNSSTRGPQLLCVQRIFSSTMA